MRGGESTETVIRMNAPVSFGGWIFYQNSYANGGPHECNHSRT